MRLVHAAHSSVPRSTFLIVLLGCTPSPKAQPPASASAPIVQSAIAQPRNGPSVSAAPGQLYRLIAIGIADRERRPVPPRARYCGAIESGWLIFRGRWWVAVDSTVGCLPGGEMQLLPVSSSEPYVVVVDSGLARGRGTAPDDTTVFESFLARQALPAGATAIGVRRGDSLMVRATDGVMVQIYRMVRR